MIIILYLYITHILIVFVSSNTPTIIGPDIYGLDSELIKLKSSLLLLNPDSVEYKKKLILYNKLLLDKQIKYTESDSIIISTSRHFYNYRHAGNVFSISNVLRKYGGHSENQSQIILPDDHICCPMNYFPGKIYVTSDIKEKPTINDELDDLDDNLNYSNIVINYRRDNFDKNKLRYLITQRYPPLYPRIARSPFRSHVFWSGVIPKPNLIIYITGHGGDRYMQINHRDYVMSQEIALYFSDLNIKNVYSRFLFLVDTCQASTFLSNIDNKLPMGWLASSSYGENSFSLHNNSTLSLTNVDQFGYYLSHYLQDICSSIITKTARAAVSRLFTSSIKRFLSRTFITSTIKSNNLPGLAASNDPHTRPKSADDDENINLYTGQFVFNYRTVYGNSHVLPLHYKRERDIELAKYDRYGTLNNLKLEIFKEAPSYMDEILKEIEIKIALGYIEDFGEVGIHAGDDYRKQYSTTFGNWENSVTYSDHVIYPYKKRSKHWYYKIRPLPELKKYHSSYSLLGQFYSFPDMEYLTSFVNMYTSDKILKDTNYLTAAPLNLTFFFYASIAFNLLLYYHPSLYR